MLRVRLYSRAACHLCHEVEADLRALADELPHELEVIDIDTSPELRRRYGTAIPVVVINRRRVLALQIDRRSLRAALQQESGGYSS